MTNSYAIRTLSLRRDFGPIHAVDDISLEIAAGTVFGFLGPNGAGKTTTIRLLLGLLEPTGGRAEVLGFDTRTQAASIREKSGALLEYNGLYERMTAEDNLEFYGRVWHMPKADRQARIHGLLTDMGLWERRQEAVGTWSRGMKQKLAVARTLLHRPALIFMDEPTAGLDPVAAAALREDLSTLAAREGVTIFLTTHNLAEAEKLCQQVGVINKGRLLAIGTLDELRAHNEALRIEMTGSGFSEAALSKLRGRPEVRGVAEKNGKLSIDLQPGVPTAPLVRLLVESGAEVEEVHKCKASLEELFLTLVEEEAETPSVSKTPGV
jgi:ABC-2 type transport system ATP-binding protein